MSETFPKDPESARPTMIDVAKRAGVGLGTVSRVVNGGAGVREETASRVRVAIDELGFQRNEVARALRPGKKSSSLALVLGDLTNPFYATIAKASLEVAGQDGFAVVLGSVDEDPEGERRAIQELIGRQVAGLMIVPDQGDHSFLRSAGVPVVFVDRPAHGIDADIVMVDNEGGGKLATDHLLQQGHRRIAILLAPSYYTTGRRLRGYRRACRAAGVEVDESLVIQLPEGTAEAAEKATRELMHRPDPPTALFASTNFLTEGVLRALRDVNGHSDAEPAEEPAVVGFDDFRLADMLPTPVTVVASDIAELGRTAARLLLDRAAKTDTRPPQRIVLPCRLIQRGSGERSVPK
ncbi:LacI family DNA-binding transcriptional regulator [Kribbella sp. CA-293567]|uniref:LacI family DNA-binding transcriptional regulator n=1 Tax=Kribbella sp. CA-293567 TaxID=3002436 RepID=UPI0022DCFFA2|nr:LacI family DNA-binding transcriptional regulator [Kribbella sp. CA-293567]WBQ07262.1 LacI family DNA-binding transcriptional regulator [Kribbella sp. CA-293567]